MLTCADQTRSACGARFAFRLSGPAFALGIEGSSHDPKARRRGTIAPERPKNLDNKKHREYKKHMTTRLSVPKVAEELGVHRNTVLNWIRQGYITATVRNGVTVRPQYVISLNELKRIKELQNVSAKRSA